MSLQKSHNITHPISSGFWTYLNIWEGTSIEETLNEMANRLISNGAAKINQTEDFVDINNEINNYLIAAIQRERAKEKLYIDFLVSEVNNAYKQIKGKIGKMSKDPATKYRREYYGRLEVILKELKGYSSELKKTDGNNMGATLTRMITNLINLSNSFDIDINNTTNDNYQKIDKKVLSYSKEAYNFIQKEKNNFLKLSSQSGAITRKQLLNYILTDIQEQFLKENNCEDKTSQIISNAVIGVLMVILERNQALLKTIDSIIKNNNATIQERISKAKALFSNISALPFSGEDSNVEKEFTKIYTMVNEEFQKKIKTHYKNKKRISNYFTASLLKGHTGKFSEISSSIASSFSLLGGTGSINPKIDVGQIEIKLKTENYTQEEVESMVEYVKNMSKTLEEALNQVTPFKLSSRRDKKGNRIIIPEEKTNRYIDTESQFNSFKKIIDNLSNEMVESCHIASISAKDYQFNMLSGNKFLNSKSSYNHNGGIKLGSKTLTDTISDLEKIGAPLINEFTNIILNTHNEAILNMKYQDKLASYIMLFYNLLMFDGMTADVNTYLNDLKQKIEGEVINRPNFVNLYKLGTNYFPLSTILEMFLDNFKTASIIATDFSDSIKKYTTSDENGKKLAGIQISWYTGPLINSTKDEDWITNVNNMEKNIKFQVFMLLDYNHFIKNLFVFNN